MKRLVADQVVGLSVGDATVDCTVGEVSGGEAALVPLRAVEARQLPPASSTAELVFTHRGGLVMLRGRMYRAGDGAEIRFGGSTRPAAAGNGGGAEQRRRAARVDIALLASVTSLDDAGAPVGDERQFLTRDMSLGGLALKTGHVTMRSGSLVRFVVTLPDLSQIGGTGRVVRAINGMCGVKFEDVAPPDRVKLASFLVSQQRPRGAAPAAAR
jgi:hypothetical protein